MTITDGNGTQYRIVRGRAVAHTGPRVTRDWEKFGRDLTWWERLWFRLVG